MKTKHALLMALLASLITSQLVFFVGRSKAADNGPRFEKIEGQSNAHNLNEAQYFEVWHDKVSGTEFICAFGENGDLGERGPSCFQSGRSWK